MSRLSQPALTAEFFTPGDRDRHASYNRQIVNEESSLIFYLGQL